MPRRGRPSRLQGPAARRRTVRFRWMSRVARASVGNRISSASRTTREERAEEVEEVLRADGSVAVEVRGQVAGEEDAQEVEEVLGVEKAVVIDVGEAGSLEVNGGGGVGAARSGEEEAVVAGVAGLDRIDDQELGGGTSDASVVGKQGPIPQPLEGVWARGDDRDGGVEAGGRTG